MQTQLKKQTKPVSYKSLVVKDGNVDITSRKVSGYLAVFGVVDSDGDILVKGCFAKSISDRGPDSATNRKIAFLWQHDMKDPIGSFSVLKEDNYGLYFESILDAGVESADRALIQLNSGTLNQFSFGFNYVWDKCELDDSIDALICKEVNLFEGSVVTLGANEFTFFAGMKSEQREENQTKLANETETVLKGLPIDQQYPIRQLMTKYIALANSQPGKPLKEDVEPHTVEDKKAFDLKEALKTTSFFN